MTRVQLEEGLPMEQQRIEFNDTALQPAAFLTDCGVKDGAVLRVLQVSQGASLKRLGRLPADL
jgi:hypothetical protein